MPKPHADWFKNLPTHRLIAEFSMWSADLVRLSDDAEKIAPYADLLHIDVADGHFAPALLFFPDLVARLRQVSSVPIHIHLMIADHVLLSQIDQFAEAGADLISIHCENANAALALDHIKKSGMKAGMVLKVDTPVTSVKTFLPQLDFVTLLGTAIGVKGQGLDPSAPSRLSDTKALIFRERAPYCTRSRRRDTRKYSARTSQGGRGNSCARITRIRSAGSRSTHGVAESLIRVP